MSCLPASKWAAQSVSASWGVARMTSAPWNVCPLGHMTRPCATSRGFLSAGEANTAIFGRWESPHSDLWTCERNLTPTGSSPAPRRWGGGIQTLHDVSRRGLGYPSDSIPTSTGRHLLRDVGEPELGSPISHM